ncbi:MULTISPECIES: bifunctional biotin--[acetyl-CoA-carboxylase] ligase/biotin operon repressor BirA [Pseudomonas aeruginosa group]|uniref:Bifunctional ligase/repressor BirA n=3 Tax=Pseudomonas aeruginosa group TaxID=136841 RepID=A0ABD7JRB9_PSEAI|nr:MULTISPECIES: bifunctional biotin--[acetyl-CoA-carboxylase] ligase/biotin operon repressor BirA [Pseudomonas aeruginosa group]KFF36287.1 biotin--protein ligase [Pseudomonas aeruginosa VRFPA01]ABR81064.2 biotin-[acetyl-CoA-carboxylase] ligase [Pseudomonas aeruginosa PA7]AVR66059.1 bifunctional biotin--[acetyl-CoA-carboxylase] ligase/biotin operon repressor BirA [Pseudomonas paraeruginosa]KAB0749810.1 bifunctional biotin--[acetyl-CoA-carboxylase] ligase/biotin operon repressor BirA [Pseudomona
MQTLLKILQDGRFHSGEELGAVLGISRSAVWKRLQHLEAEHGLQFHKVRGRGYRLASPISLLDPQRIEGFWPVEILSAIDSTNSEAMRRLAAGASTPFVLVAEQQTAGRGRRGRVWISPYGENLYYSLAVTVRGGARELEGLSLVVGLAVLKVLDLLQVSKAGLKWPNDLLQDGRKIAGILLELSGDPADLCQVVIGIGINVNMKVATDIDQPWTSLREALGGLVDRSHLLSVLNQQLAWYLDRHSREGFAASREEWEARNLWQGALVSLSTSSTSIEGRVLGVDARGALRLEVGGVEQSFSGGELSLRLRNDS